jgi:hypothetical protein
MKKGRILVDIYDDSDEDHHPPGYLAYKGDIVYLRRKTQWGFAVSHNSVGPTFVVDDATELKVLEEGDEG